MSAEEWLLILALVVAAAWVVGAIAETRTGLWCGYHLARLRRDIAWHAALAADRVRRLTHRA